MERKVAAGVRAKQLPVEPGGRLVVGRTDVQHHPLRPPTERQEDAVQLVPDGTDMIAQPAVLGQVVVRRWHGHAERGLWQRRCPPPLWHPCARIVGTEAPQPAEILNLAGLALLRMKKAGGVTGCNVRVDKGQVEQWQHHNRQQSWRAHAKPAKPEIRSVGTPHRPRPACAVAARAEGASSAREQDDGHANTRLGSAGEQGVCHLRNDRHVECQCLIYRWAAVVGCGGWRQEVQAGEHAPLGRDRFGEQQVVLE
eukprot:scaffold4886_cov123-Isochrysis_galbana.AAC.8